MKKLILLSACLLAVPALHAEQMQFVTTLSAPVGNFAHLDAADPTHVTSAPLLNFCNTRSGVGDIIIKGANAYIAKANILNGATLGSTNTPEYRLSEKLTVENGGTVTAGRLMASNVTFQDTNFHKSNVTGTLYGRDLTVKGGKTDNMEIASTAKITKSAQTSANLGQTMEWSNQYSGDYDSSGNKKANGNTYTSFLLKSKGGTVNRCSTCSSYDEDSAEYENCVLNNVSSCCKYAYDIYTNRGQDAKELMKETSCYTCTEHINGSEPPVITHFTVSPSMLEYYAGASFSGGTIIGAGGPGTGVQPLNCLTYIPNNQTQHFYPVQSNDHPAGLFYPIDNACPDDGNMLCGGKGACLSRCEISGCTIFNSTDGTLQCTFTSGRRLCTTDCIRNW